MIDKLVCFNDTGGMETTLATRDLAALRQLAAQPVDAMSEQDAATYLHWGLSLAEQDRLSDLVERNQAGRLTGAETDELKMMNQIVNRLSLLRIKAQARLDRVLATL